MPKFFVDCTVVYNGGVVVDAEGATEALCEARKILSEENDYIYLPAEGSIGSVDFNFSSATADYAERLDRM